MFCNYIVFFILIYCIYFRKNIGGCLFIVGEGNFCCLHVTGNYDERIVTSDCNELLLYIKHVLLCQDFISIWCFFFRNSFERLYFKRNRPDKTSWLY